MDKQKSEKDIARIKRQAKIRIESKRKQKQLAKDYDKFMKKNKGWPTAKKEQVVQRKIKHYE